MTIMPHYLLSWLFSLKTPKAKSSLNQKSPKQKISSQLAIETTGNDQTPCCSPMVHIAYRGVSDDRLYLSYNRKWQEVKFFRPQNLRVFCKECRRRIY